jgi:pimeloyl-ACP methyl ester carboxylesterase
MGGGEVARYIGRYGTERIARAVLASAVPPYLYRSNENPGGGLDDATIGAFEAGVKGDRIAFVDQFVTNFFTAGSKGLLVSEPTRLYNRMIAAFASPKGTLDCIGAFARTDFRNDLDKFDVPTLVIHGESDGIVPFEVSGKRSHESISGSELVLIKDGPHGCNVTHAADFNSALLGFLAKEAAPPKSRQVAR